VDQQEFVISVPDAPTVAGDANTTGEVARVVVDSLSDGGDNKLDALRDAWLGNAHDHWAALDEMANPGAAAVGSWNSGHMALLSMADSAFDTQPPIIHHHAPLQDLLCTG
jgi:glycerate kinase